MDTPIADAPKWLLAAIQSHKSINRIQAGYRNAHDVKTWEDLWVLLRQAVMRHPTARMQRDGWWHCKGICHDGVGNTAIMFDSATGKVKCMAGCDSKTVLRAFGLPEGPTADEKEAGVYPKKMSQASRLVNLAEAVEFFHTPEGITYATVPVQGHSENIMVKSNAFREWLIREYRRTAGASPGAQSVQDALNDLSGRARFDGPEYEVHTRIAELDGAIYLDLCDLHRRVVQITSNGWQVIKESPVKFRRARGMLQLPEPTRGGSVKALRRLINITDKDWPLVVSWLVAAFRPGRPFPILALHGEQGSAKSTTARFLRNLIDPNKAALRSEPRNEHDLMIAATNGWIISLDNLSRLSIWLSDALCRLATGGGFATRELYANDEEILFDAKRPVMLNGIEELVTRSDLLDRSIILNLSPIQEHQRRAEVDVWREFETERPAILGGFMDAVSHALRDHERVHLERLPRMADFASWSIAAESSLGLKQGEFIAVYTGNRAISNELALEASPVAAALVAFVEHEKQWIGTASELLESLNAKVSEAIKLQEGWPKSGQGLSGALKRLAPNLRAIGINYTRPGRSGKKGSRLICLEYIGVLSSEVSEASESSSK